MSIPGKLARTILSNKMTTANAVLSLGFGIDSYQTAREEGSGVIGALGTAAFDTVLPMVTGMIPYLAFEGITSVAPAAIQGYDQYSRQLGAQYNKRGPFAHAQFNDTEQAYTMRQAGMAIAKRSRYNINQAMLGNEAKYMMK